MNSIIVRGHVARVDLPGLAINGDRYLYTTKYNYVDLNADENGIWAIYTTQYSKNTHVVKVNRKFPSRFAILAKQMFHYIIILNLFVIVINSWIQIR